MIGNKLWQTGNANSFHGTECDTGFFQAASFHVQNLSMRRGCHIRMLQNTNGGSLMYVSEADIGFLKGGDDTDTSEAHRRMWVWGCEYGEDGTWVWGGLTPIQPIKRSEGGS